MARRISRLRTAWRLYRYLGRSRGYGAGRPGSLTGGGVANATTGMGTGLDKSEASFFTPTRIWWRTPLQVLVVESFAARLAVRLPVRDMFLQRRRFMGESGDTIKDFEKALAMYRVDERVRDAMIAGRQYGTGLLVIMTPNDPMDTPLVPERIREGDLGALRVFSRFDVSAIERDFNMMSPGYGKPLFYNLHPSYGGQRMRVHESRVIRFEGIADPSDSGLDSYERDWGVSILVPITNTLLHEAGLAQAVAHLTQVASVPVLHIENLREAIAGREGDEETSVEEIGEGINHFMSLYRLMMLDKGSEEFTRVAVQFGGLANLYDRAWVRVAAAAEIPVTRFWQTSAKGLNATGEGDMNNYIMTFEAERQNTLPAVYERLDPIVARSAGLGEVPEYEWPSMLDPSEKDRSEVALNKVKAAREAIDGGMIDEDEGRLALDGDSVLGALPGSAPELPPPDPNAFPGGPPPQPSPEPGPANAA